MSQGDLAAEDVRKALWNRNVSFVRAYDRAFSGLFLAVAILWLLPGIATWSGWRFLSFFARLSRVDFPVAVIVTGAVLFVAAISLEVKLNLMRQKLGGCHDMHETVVIVREGPYSVIRHPGYLAEMVYFGVLPIVLSRWVPFTVLAAIASIVAIAGLAYLIRAEDSFNMRKWGEEYRQYMEEVPAVNFLKGLRKHRLE